MRSTWPFVAGIIIAGLITLVTLPVAVVAGSAMVMWGRFGHEDSSMSGASSFAVREEQGRLSVRMVNHGFTTVSVPVPGEPRPRRLVVRQQVAAGDSSGHVRIDAWPLDSAGSLNRPPLYTVFAAGTTVTMGEDGLFWIERQAGAHASQRSAYSLASGEWLFDADTPLVAFALDGDQRRLAAMSLAEEEVAARAVASITYAASNRVLRRLLLTADDPLRARMLRATIPATRLVSRIDETGKRVLELPLPSGTVRLPVKADDLDLAAASVPAGLTLLPLDRWRGGK